MKGNEVEPQREQVKQRAHGGEALDDVGDRLGGEWMHDKEQRCGGWDEETGVVWQCAGLRTAA